MAAILQPTAARRYLERLQLSNTDLGLALAIIDLLDGEGRVKVAMIRDKHFPFDNVSAVNKRLSDLRRAINQEAEATGSTFRIQVTSARNIGAERRFIWFEAERLPAPTASTGELDAIGPEQLIDAKAVETGPTATAVVLTFNTNEAQAVWREFTGSTAPPQRYTGRGITYYELGACGGMRIIHRHSEQGSLNALASTLEAIDHFDPEIVIASGIAFGADESKQSIGDVLVSEAVLPYELARVEPDGTHTHRDHPRDMSYELIERARALTLEHADNMQFPVLRIGIVLSGDKLVDNITFRDALCSAGNVVGGEMEGSGLHTACRERRVEGLVVKGISDWGDGNKNGRLKSAHQKQAARAAATVTRAILERGPLSGPRPRANTTLGPTPTQHTPRPAPTAACSAPAADHMGRHDAILEDRSLLIRDTQASTLELKHGAAPPDAQGTLVLEAMLRWATNPTEPRLFALLGEYGMGKTVTCQRLARKLGAERANDPTVPMPLYFNLKTITNAEIADDLETLITTCMREDWLPRHSAAHTWEAFKQWLAAGPCVVIFDGLDEILVKLSRNQGQSLLHRLLGVLHLLEEDELNKRVRLVLSCRTQYFKDLDLQRNFFLERGRSDVKPDSYRAMTLLPLTEKQVRTYLTAAIPDQDPEKLMDLLKSVHNLSELSTRPFSLDMIRDNVAELEAKRARKERVLGVTLYRLMVDKWLMRDEGKHFIRPEHKAQFMSALAAWLWRQGLSCLSADRAEVVFRRWLAEDQDRQYAYSSTLSVEDRESKLSAGDRERLAEDLRTATFLAREDGPNASTFRFAHTSLLEFFLANYLLDAIRRDDRSAWQMRTPSTETLDFLGQLLAEADDPSLVSTLTDWKAPYLAQASELLLHYVLHAKSKEYPTPDLARIDLSGADLDDMVFAGTPTTLLNLAEANLAGASLRRSVFAWANLTGACFTGATLTQAEFHNSTSPEVAWNDATMGGASWYQAMNMGTPAMPTLKGHTRSVTAVAWSPDASRLATTSRDGTCIIWNPTTGDQL
ncbi:hypothetical protein HMPREF1531_00943, partial [Propionibacterium sp. oral taxon 192 str. F0372]|uniref:phosphorylase family protein n=1 Tax=Propionibacterium sp. oral taxon 192 TaxID=671222 RepID=UPI000353CDC5